MMKLLNMLSFNVIMQEHRGLTLILGYLLPNSLTLLLVNGRDLS